jgi:hypothetical protein
VATGALDGQSGVLSGIRTSPEKVSRQNSHATFAWVGLRRQELFPTVVEEDILAMLSQADDPKQDSVPMEKGPVELDPAKKQANSPIHESSPISTVVTPGTK